MYLSKLILNPHSRQVRNELADPYEMHRTISKAFKNGALSINRIDHNNSGILFRVDIDQRTATPIVLVQARIKPDWTFLLEPEKKYLYSMDDLPPGSENPAVKEVDVQFHPGQKLAFRLRANPTVKKDRDGKKQGHRVGIIREEDQLKWLERKIRQAGCKLLAARVSNEAFVAAKLFLEKQAERRMKFLSVQFDGYLHVDEPTLLLTTLQTGIGSGKGLGFGLLSLAPMRG